MKEKHKLYSSVGLLIGLNLLIKPLWIFGIERQVQNVVGTETYGQYFAVLNFSFVFSFLLDWGLSGFFNRQLAADEQNYSYRTGNFLRIKLLFSLLYAAVVILVAYATGLRQWAILLPVIAIQALTSIFVFFRSIVTGRQWFISDAWLSVLDKTLMILVCGSFLYLPVFGKSISIQQFLYVQVICTSVSVLSVLLLLLQKGIRFPLSVSGLLDRRLFIQALPYACIVLLMTVHNRLDGFLLERLHPNGAYEAGIYAGAYRLLEAAMMIGFLLGSFLLPFLARHWSDKKMISAVILNSRHLLLLASVFTGCSVYFLAPWIQQLLYHNSDAAGITVLQLCLPVLAGYSLIQVYGTVMTAGGQVKHFSYIVLASVCINIALNLVFIPQWGAKGSCLAALFSQGICAISVLLYTHLKSGINMQIRSLLMYIFIAAALAGYYYLAGRVQLDNRLQLLGAGAIVLAAALFFKLTSIRQWKGLLKL